MSERLIISGGPIFDGERLLDSHALILADGVVQALGPVDAVSDSAARHVDLGGDILAPGYVDLQVNGGDGVMLNDDPSLATICRMIAAHRRLGVDRIFPTLITDTPDHSRAAIDAARQASRAGLDGFGGLHLEGPHLSLVRKGAHDPALIRQMQEDDLVAACDAAASLPALMMTLAPENVTPEQVSRLSRAGVIVSLGHTDADYETITAYRKAGASCVTHLFNAMSQLGSRAPGLVGAALQDGGLSAGLIADGVHVHPATMRSALAAKAAPGQIFLVSDAMAPAGTNMRSFTLNGRTIRREDGRLLLADGTLAGADLDLTMAIDVLLRDAGQSLQQALRMATSIPAHVGRQPAHVGRLIAGKPAVTIRLHRGKDRLTLRPLS